jgi:hypothetical protein
LAKQFGVGDDALAGLKDPARHPFPPDQKAALQFADAMTNGPGRVTDADYSELRRHFSEPQIVEIATVIGLFNYFNRFNNALHVEVTLMDPDVLLRRVEEAAARATSLDDLLDAVAGILKEGRRYSRVVIDRKASSGMGSEKVPDTKQAPGRITLVIAAGRKVAGTLTVESDREIANDEEERSFLGRVAKILAAKMA